MMSTANPDASRTDNYGVGEGVGMNIVIVSVLLSIATVIVVPIGFVFGGLWGLLLAEFASLLILAGLYLAEEKFTERRDTARSDGKTEAQGRAAMIKTSS
jgi:hypothetical protein